MQEQSWKLNYVTAHVELSHEECPFDRPERVFAAVARKLQASPTGPADVDRSLGFDQVLCQLFDRRFEGVLTGMAQSEDLIKNARQFATELKLIPAESSALLNAASVHLLDQGPYDSSAGKAYLASAIPSYWLIGRDGRIRLAHAPRPSEGTATVAAIEQALVR